MKLLVAPILALFAACAPIRFSSQEIALRHRPEPDTLDVLFLYDGIQAEPQDGDKDGVDVGSRFARRVALGKRELMVFDWPLHLDLDEILQDLAKIEPSDGEPWSVWKREGLEHLESVNVVASGLYAGDEGRVSLYQQFRVERWTRLVDWFDRSLRLWITDRNADGTLEQRLSLLSPETRAAWVDMAKAKKRWLTIADGGLEVKLPMTPADAARVFARSVEQESEWKDDDALRFLAGLTAGMGAVEIASGHLRLAWKAEDGMLRFRFAGPEGYDEHMAKEMRSSKEFPSKLPARAEVLRRFRGD